MSATCVVGERPRKRRDAEFSGIGTSAQPRHFPALRARSTRRDAIVRRSSLRMVLEGAVKATLGSKLCGVQSCFVSGVDAELITRSSSFVEEDRRENEYVVSKVEEQRRCSLHG